MSKAAAAAALALLGSDALFIEGARAAGGAPSTLHLSRLLVKGAISRATAGLVLRRAHKRVATDIPIPEAAAAAFRVANFVVQTPVSTLALARFLPVVALAHSRRAAAAFAGSTLRGASI